MSIDSDNRGKPKQNSLQQNPISIENLLSGQVPQQINLNNEAQEDYRLFSTATIHTLVNSFEDQKEIIIIGTPLRGIELQHLFHFAAPSKKHRYDFADTQNDWHQLYANPLHAERLKKHQGIPGWDIFELHRETLREFIGKDYRDSSATDHVVPVVRIKKDGNKTTWDFSPLNDGTKQTLNETLEIQDLESVRYLPVLGPLFVAAFSPAKMADWGPKLTYRLKELPFGQDMGSTQAFALSLAISDRLLDAPFLNTMVEYAESGTIPEKGDSDAFTVSTTPFPESATIWSSPDIYYLAK